MVQEHKPHTTYSSPFTSHYTANISLLQLMSHPLILAKRKANWPSGFHGDEEGIFVRVTANLRV